MATRFITHFHTHQPLSQTLYEPGPGVSEPRNVFLSLEKRAEEPKPQLGIEALRERNCLPTVGGSVYVPDCGPGDSLPKCIFSCSGEMYSLFCVFRVLAPKPAAPDEGLFEATCGPTDCRSSYDPGPGCDAARLEPSSLKRPPPAKVYVGWLALREFSCLPTEADIL